MYLELAVCLPHEAATVGFTRQITKGTLHGFGVTSECIDDINLALSEACANVIEHAATEDVYEVRIRIDEEYCTISVTDTSGGFDATGAGDVMPGAGSARGRGVAIMRALMDHVDLTSEPESGTIVQLVKRLDLVADAPIARLRRRAKL